MSKCFHEAAGDHKSHGQCRMALKIALALAFCLFVSSSAEAHFLWIVAQGADGPSRVHVYFGETAEPDDPDLLDFVADARVRQRTRDGKLFRLLASKGDDSLTATPVKEADATSAFLVDYTHGVITRGDETFLLNYYAKTPAGAGRANPADCDCSDKLVLDVVPNLTGNRLELTVKWRKEPIGGVQVMIEGPGLDSLEGTTDDRGQFQCRLAGSGLYSIRARHIEQNEGQHEGEEYASVRHYSTLALPYTQSSENSNMSYSDLPQGLTSFGAAVCEGWLYVYGGHTGEAHSYSIEEQSNAFLRLNLNSAEKWEELRPVPRLQGLAMVAYGGRLYRIGGFQAKNHQGQDQILVSTRSFARFDPAKAVWQDLPSLPEPRSSHDAVVIGDTLYVAGGWNLQGDGKTDWHKTAWSIDLTADPLIWSKLPDPPFERRALALGECDGKLHVIGGMQKEGGPTTRVDVYDPATQSWSRGPDLQGEGMEGFGGSAFAVGGHLFVSTFNGHLQRLNDDRSQWDVVEQLHRARFFHRMLPLSETELILVGGANMESGKFLDLETVSAK